MTKNSKHCFIWGGEGGEGEKPPSQLLCSQFHGLLSLSLLTARLFRLFSLGSLGGPASLLRRAGGRLRRLGNLIFTGSLPLASGTRLLRLGGRSIVHFSVSIGTTKLLCNGGLVVGTVVVRHRDVMRFGICKSLIVVHVLGVGVSSLVGMNTGVVQAKVILIGLIPTLHWS